MNISIFKKKSKVTLNKFIHSPEQRGKNWLYRIPSIPIKDVWDVNKKRAVLELRKKKLIERDLLISEHDDYHTLLRLVVALLKEANKLYFLIDYFKLTKI